MIIKVPIFNYTIKLYIGDTDKVAVKYNCGDVSDYDAFVFRAIDKRKYSYIAIFREGLKTSILVHEATHLANMILTDIGHKIDGDNDEVQAYLLQWIFEQISKRYEEQRGA